MDRGHTSAGVRSQISSKERTIEMNNLQILPSVTVSVSSPWLDQFSHFLQSDYRKITRRHLSQKSIRLAVQHTHVFGMWHTATFHEPFEPAMTTNYDLHLYRKWSLDNEKVKAATWNSRHWALSILCMWIESTHGTLRVKLMDGVEQKQSGITAWCMRSNKTHAASSQPSNTRPRSATGQRSHSCSRQDCASKKPHCAMWAISF